MKITETLAIWKQRFQYAGGFFSVFSMPILIVDLIQRRLAEMHVAIPMLYIIVPVILLIFLFGYVMDKLGLYAAEMRYQLKNVPKEEVLEDA